MLMTNEGTPDMHKNIFKENKPKMAYSRDAFIETREDREGLERDRESRGTIDRLQKDWQDTIYGAMADGLSQTNKIAREIQRELDGPRESKRGDMKPFRQLVYKQTD